MSRGARVRQADVTHAVKALDAAGFTIAAIEVRAGGIVQVIPGARKPPGVAAPDLTPPPAAAPDDGDELSRFRRERAGRASERA